MILTLPLLCQSKPLTMAFRSPPSNNTNRAYYGDPQELGFCVQTARRISPVAEQKGKEGEENEAKRGAEREGGKKRRRGMRKRREGKSC